jgi:hypothetical protein
VSDDAPPAGFWAKVYDALVGQEPSVVLGSLVGAFGLLNLLDSLVIAYGGMQWQIVPDVLEPFFALFREATRAVFSLLEGLIRIHVPSVAQDYLIMGFIVAGMRLRSTIVILSAVSSGDLKKYREEIFGWKLTVRPGSSFGRWLAFFAIRLLFALVLWPVKLFGACSRYLRGNLRDRGRGPKREKIQSKQYLTFFGTVAWALVGLLMFLILGAVGA